MATVSIRTKGTSPDDSIFALLDQSWYSQSILKHSIAFEAPDSASASTGVESSTDLRSSEIGSASGTPSASTECSRVQSVDDCRLRRKASNSGSEFLRYSMDETEMRRVFDWLDSNGDGLISGDELHWYTKRCGTDLPDAEANSMISSVDLNNDGRVDFEEFLLLYQTHCSGDAIGEDDRTSRVDEEQDLLQAFRVFDRNDDGLISAQELQAVLLNLGMPEGKSLISCEAMIRIVDRNGDGQCDIREFQEMMAEQSNTSTSPSTMSTHISN